jgi:hypothetical protein
VDIFAVFMEETEACDENQLHSVRPREFHDHGILEITGRSIQDLTFP